LIGSDRAQLGVVKKLPVEIDRFMDKLKNCLERYISKVIIVQLFGIKSEFESIGDVLEALTKLEIDNTNSKFEKFEVIVDYNNNDTIRATFQDKNSLAEFLHKLNS